MDEKNFFTHRQLEIRLAISDFARRSFRDVADHDYVLSRVAFRMGLGVQFLYLAHQAIEKYLKALLLFNRRSTKSIVHDLQRGLDEIESSLPFKVEMPSDVREFIEHLGTDAIRYFEYSYGVSGRKLRGVDRAVWHIRRYCADWYVIDRSLNGTFTETLSVPLERLHADKFKERPQDFRLPSRGILEEILASSDSPLRSDLIWNNPYFGEGTAVPEHHLGGSSANPTLALHPDAFEELDKLVRFSPPLRDAFRRRRADSE